VAAKHLRIGIEWHRCRWRDWTGAFAAIGLLIDHDTLSIDVDPDAALEPGGKGTLRPRACAPGDASSSFTRVLLGRCRDAGECRTRTTEGMFEIEVLKVVAAALHLG